MDRQPTRNWESLRSGLLAVRDTVRAHRDGADIDPSEPDVLTGAELKALDDVGSQPYFSRYRSSSNEAVVFGGHVVAAIGVMARGLRAAPLPRDPSALSLFLWSDALAEGHRPGELARNHAELLPAGRGAGSPEVAAELRVRSLMWLRGNRGRTASTAGILRLRCSVDLALRSLVR